MSRPLIELTVRQRVKQYTNILIREHCRVQGLVATPDGGTVSSIRFENGDGRSEILATDLVVEASGRGNLTLGLLESIDQPPPEETTIGIDITYATATGEVKFSPPIWSSRPRGAALSLLFFLNPLTNRRPKRPPSASISPMPRRREK